MNPEGIREFEKNPHLQAIIRVRRYDDGGKIPGTTTPAISHYMNIVQQVLDDNG